MSEEVEIKGIDLPAGDYAEEWRERLQDAIGNASDQDRSTRLLEDGKPVAAIVPIEVLEFYERAMQHAQEGAFGYWRLT
jgi:methyl coenzyme M reductase beta subunit